MTVLWAKSPQRSSEIMAALAPVADWHPNTVKTLLTRLVKKKAVSAKPERNHYLFSAEVGEGACVKAESAAFLERVYGGTVKSLLLHYIERHKFSAGDVDELKQVLRKRQK